MDCTKADQGVEWKVSIRMLMNCVAETSFLIGALT